MTERRKETTEQQKMVVDRSIAFRKPYSKPFLAELGDLRALTLGGSLPTIEDSYSGSFSHSIEMPPPPIPPM